MKFSPFNPIYFQKKDAPKDGAMTDYAHIFSPDDHIFFEVFHKSSVTIGPLKLLDATNGNLIVELLWNTYPINDSNSVSFYDLRGIDPGCYVLDFGEWISNTISVTENPEVLDDTVLIQYSTASNTMRTDVYPDIKSRLRYFEIRLGACFKDKDWSFAVENNQFVTDKSDATEITAIESTDKILTVGRSDGVPMWVGEKLNHILACKLIFIDGERYSYSGGNSVEISPVGTTDDRFVFSIQLRKARFVNAHYEKNITSLFRKIPSRLRSVNSNLRKI